ncbi:hypothetical protein K2173_022602 [Erythroxylum novogranatense]|uniref:SUI1 domain-containing protein n=1 Tax=Erythroxylum novogranatense TaxID=1862640 RepID=A0AAV8TNZ5_9ROSI|nr:hypothetical protein K2173_022602 [Erythroxylum novogranatense]
MSDIEVQIPTTFDPFSQASAEDSGAGAKDYVHIRMQQRNGRKSLTTILKDLKKEFYCNGTVLYGLHIQSCILYTFIVTYMIILITSENISLKSIRFF